VRLPVVLLALVAACGGDPIAPPPPPPPPPGSLPTPSVACSGQPVTQLAVGEHVILDPVATSGCLRVPAAGAQGAQHLLVFASANGNRSASGVQGSYLLRGSSPAASAAPEAGPETAAPQLFDAGAGRRSAGAEFDAMLRERERELLANPLLRAAPRAAPPVTPAPPPLGDVRSFKACAALACSTVTTVTATARYVGTHVAVYIDNDVPQSDPLTPADAEELGEAFDTYHYPIDTTAFGRESDLDGNGVVIILMTDAVNSLTTDCSNGRVVGYFFGGDLLPIANSNNGEIFFTLVPAPQAGTCNAIGRRTAVDNLKPTLIHEFQHMISFNQRALVRQGNSEDVWLNEALSHFAEELGGRLIPNSECTPSFTSCRSQYTSSDLVNSYDYLANSEAHFVVYPNGSSGTLQERGAGWLLLRWSIDQFAADSILGTQMTRALVGTTLSGTANLTAATGGSFATMIPQWLMAAYLDDGTDLPAEPTGRLRFKSWGFRTIWTNPLNQEPNGPFSGFPIVPDVISGTYSRSGNVKAGSGRHFLVTQAASGSAIDIQVLRSTAGTQLDPALVARFGLVRVR
jgi:hypothetical protein